MWVSESRLVVSDSLQPHGLYRPPGSSVRGILQARILEWVAIPFTRGCSPPRDQTQVFHIAGRFLTLWATREAQNHHMTQQSQQWGKCPEETEIEKDTCTPMSMAALLQKLGHGNNLDVHLDVLDEQIKKLWCIYMVEYLVQFSRSVTSNSLRPHGLKHASLPCPSRTPRACLNSYPTSQWCHPIISFSVIPFSSHLQSFPALGYVPMSQFFP